MINDPNQKIKKYSLGERNFDAIHGGNTKFGDIHGITIRNDQYRLIIAIDNKGDTVDVLLFNNFEYPIPHTNIANRNFEIVNNLIKELKRY
jgi:mRNA-degrading endonuclease RelE of RelBE toxin-antitoxin system